MNNMLTPENEVNSNDLSIEWLLKKIGNGINFLIKFKYLLIFFAISGFISGIIYANSVKPTYSARISFVVEEGKSNNASLGGLASLAGQFGVDVGGSSGSGLLSGDNILLYLISNNLTREVLLSNFDKLSNKSIADFYVESSGFKKDWINNEKIGKVNFAPNQLNYTRLQDSLLEKITYSIVKNQLFVNRIDKKAGFIEVTAKMNNEILSKIFCERLVSIAVDKYVKIKTARQQSTVDKLQFRVDSISSILQEKTFFSAKLQNENNTLDINPLYKTNSTVAVESNMREKTILSTIFATVTQNLEMAKFTLSQETPVIQIVDYPILPLKKERLSRIKSGILFSIISITLLCIFLLIFKFKKSILFRGGI